MRKTTQEILEIYQVLTEEWLKCFNARHSADNANKEIAASKALDEFRTKVWESL